MKPPPRTYWLEHTEKKHDDPLLEKVEMIPAIGNQPIHLLGVKPSAVWHCAESHPAMSHATWCYWSLLQIVLQPGGTQSLELIWGVLGYFPIWAPTTTRKQRIDDGKFQTWMKCFIPLKNRKGILQPAMLVFQGGPKYSSLVAELSPSLILFQIWSILEVKDHKMRICWICCFEIIPYHNTGLYGKPISTRIVDLDFQKVDTSSVFHQENTAAKTFSKDHTMTTIRLTHFECDETTEGKGRSRDSKPCNIWWKNLPSTPFPLGCVFLDGRWRVNMLKTKQTSENCGVVFSNELEKNWHSSNWNPSAFFWGEHLNGWNSPKKILWKQCANRFLFLDWQTWWPTLLSERTWPV